MMSRQGVGSTSGKEHVTNAGLPQELDEQRLHRTILATFRGLN
jgi:hypothetical protein